MKRAVRHWRFKNRKRNDMERFPVVYVHMRKPPPPQINS